MRRSPPGSDLGPMAGGEGEADAAVVQEDAGRGLDEVRAEVERVGLGERDPEPVGVQGAQVRRVAVADACHGGARAAVAGHDVGRCGPLGAHPRRRRSEAVGVQQRGAVGAVEEDVGAVVADGTPRLDEQVRPERVVGVGCPGRPRRRPDTPASVR